MVATTCSSTLPLCQRFWMRIPPPDVRRCSNGPPPLIAARRLCLSPDVGTAKSLETEPPLVLASRSTRRLRASSTLMLPPDVDNRHDSFGCAERKALTLPPEVEASTAPVVSRIVTLPPEVCALTRPLARLT